MRGWEDRLQRTWSSRGALACALWPLAALYGALSAVHRSAARRSGACAPRLRAPVVVVGNLIAGGAGKTPVVMAVVAALRRGGYTPGIVSRGYGGSAEGLLHVRPDTHPAESGDEPLLLRLRTGAPVVVGRDRAAAARELLQHYADIDVLVSDDGLQHLRLMRDVQVLVFDERGVGNGWLLPAGPLRERLPSTVPARSLVVYNAAAPSTPLPGTLARRSIAGLVQLGDWRRGQRPTWAGLERLRGCTVVAAAGTAWPERFFGMLRDLGLQIEPLALPDHHNYAVLPWPADTTDVVVTEKDAVKIEPSRLGTTRVWVAPLDFRLDASFETALIALLSLPRIEPDGNAIA